MTEGNNLIRLAILEDQVFFQERLLIMLQDWPLIDKIHCFINNREFQDFLETSAIDVLLVDLDLPDGSGTESIKKFSSCGGQGLSIVISASLDTRIILDAIAQGAVGYLHKEDNSINIRRAIQMVLSGESPISPSIAYRICQNLQEISGTPQLEYVEGQKLLSERELEVLLLISKGLSYQEVSDTLAISSKTVPVFIRKIYRKLQAKNRAEAVYEARSLGILR